MELSRSNKARTVWIVFDGRLTSHFTGIVETLMLESPRMIQSPISDNIYLPRNVEVVFETVSMGNCSPSFITNCTTINIRICEIHWPSVFPWIKSGRRDNWFKSILLNCVSFFFPDYINKNRIHIVLRAANTMRHIIEGLFLEETPQDNYIKLGTK